LLLLLFVATATWLSAGVAADDADSRFSKSLTPGEITASGISRLSADQVAILDALVRRDVAAAHFTYKTPRAVRFSDRLTADERQNSGLAALSTEQLAEIDAYVQRLQPAPPGSWTASASSSGTATSGSAGTSVTAMSLRRKPQIHGEVSLMYGAGSGGYSEYGGSMVLTYDDPDHNYAIAVGYSEIHTKGGYWRNRCYYDDPLFYRDSMVSFRAPLLR
jgi:hypothetical protein